MSSTKLVSTDREGEADAHIRRLLDLLTPADWHYYHERDGVAGYFGCRVKKTDWSLTMCPGMGHSNPLEGLTVRANYPGGKLLYVVHNSPPSLIQGFVYLWESLTKRLVLAQSEVLAHMTDAESSEG